MKLDTSTSTSIAITASVVVVALTTTAFVFYNNNKKKSNNNMGSHNDDHSCGEHSKRKKNGETWESHIGEHGPLKEIWPSTLYLLEAAGCEMGPPVRNMTIYRVPDNSRRLVIFNGIAVNDATIAEIELLGTPTILVVPNWHHRCCAAVWKKKYPNILVVCPECAVTSVTEIVPVDTTMPEWAKMEDWSKWIQVKLIDGWAEFEPVLEVALDASGILPSSSSAPNTNPRAMLVSDLLFTLPFQKDASFLERLIVWFFDSSIELPSDDAAKTMIIVPKVSRIARLFAIKDWKKAETWYRTYAREFGSSIKVIAVGHGPPVQQIDSTLGCSEALEGVASQLMKPRW